jgi:hypothetical protein
MIDLLTARMVINRHLSQMNITSSSVTITGFEESGKNVKIDGYYDSYFGDGYKFTCTYEPATQKLIYFRRLEKNKSDFL